MATWTLAFFLGTLVFHYGTWTTAWLIGAVGLACCCLPACCRYVGFCLLAFFVGYLWTAAYVHHQHAWLLPEAWVGKDLLVQGVIADVPDIDQQRVKWVYHVDTVNGDAQSFRALLTWYQGPDEVRAGDRWQLQVRLKPPHGFANPGGFDYEKWLFLKGIQATGYVRKSEKNQYLSTDFSRRSLARLRQYIAQQLDTGSKFSGFVQALTVGVRHQMSTQQWEVLQATGTSHLMAISGLHVSLVASVIYLLVTYSWRRVARLCLLTPAPLAGAIAAMIAALAYAALAGFSVPTQRAFLMLSVAMLALIGRRYLTLWQGFFVALLWVLVLDPLAPLSVGFYLSFSAVAWIFFGFLGRIGVRSPWWRWGRVQWVVCLGLAPLTCWFFQQTSLVAFVANMLAIPIVGVVIVPLALLAAVFSLVSVTVSHGLLMIIDALFYVVYLGLVWLSQWPFAVLWFTLPRWWVAVACLLAVLLMLAPRGFPGRYLSIVLLLPMFFYRLPGPDHGEVWLTVLDVGQGLATVLRTANHVMLFDTGPRFHLAFDAGGQVILPFLRSQQIKGIDKIVLSHSHWDHIGGVWRVLDTMPVADVVVGEQRHLEGISTRYCLSGDAWVWEGVQFEFLYPQAPDQRRSNDNSCVLKVSVGDQAILLTGDIEQWAEQWLLEHRREALVATVLQVPHHGSRTSSSVGFIEAVAPQVAIIGSGYLNRFGFPHEEVVARYQNQGVRLLNVADLGAVTVKLSHASSVISVESHR